MKKYKTVLIDLDDTLFDFGQDQKVAFKEAMRQIGQDCTEEMYETYCKINLELWEMLNVGKIELKVLLTKRFDLFFEKYGIKQKAKEFDEILTTSFQKTGTPIKGAREALEYLSGKYELVVTSNGPKNQQYHRLGNADFLKYFSQIFISEEVGFNKPNKEFFDIVFQKIETKDKSQILIIGDSLSSDIKGGRLVGIDTCWYHTKKEENQIDHEPTFTIQNWQEIKQIL